MLPPREATVLRMRFGIGLPEEYSLQTIGEQLKMSREGIRQLEMWALRRLEDSGYAATLRELID